jgi:two-component system, cell cycle sensor histidine kinase and response regulator CckA
VTSDPTGTMPGGLESLLPDIGLSYRDILDVSSDALFIHDETGRIVFANQRACVLFGYGPEEFHQLSADALCLGQAPYNHADAIRNIQTTLANGQHTFTWRSKRRDGSLFWSEVALRRCTFSGKTWIIASIRDIDDHKKAEDALRKSEEKLSKIFHGSSNSMAVTELATGRIVDVNKTWMEASGLTLDAAQGKTALELSLWCKSADRENCLAELARTGFIRNFETTLTLRSGATPILISAQTIELDDKPYTLWEFRDITVRKRTEEALRHSEESLREAQRIANIGSWDLDLANNKLFWSEQMFRICEVDAKEFGPSYEDFLDVVHPEDRDTVNRVYTDSVKNLAPFEIVHRLRMKDGRVKYVQVRGETRGDSKRRPLRSVGTAQDITKDKLAEEEKASLEAQLHHAQRMESVGRLAGGVAHDFNNMLGVILGHAEMVIDGLDPTSPLLPPLDEIRKAARRSADLTRQLLAFARKQTVTPKVLNLNQAVADMLKMLQRLIGEDIHITWEPSPNLWSIKVDPAQIDQILANLCVNARDAITDVGKLTIETRNSTFDDDYCAAHPGFLAGEYVRIAVSDNGCGMDKETLGHIFEPFFTTKAAGTGTGLGLATVYGVVRQNNGFLNVYSEPGHGTTFAIYLPRHVGAGTSARTEGMTETPLRGHETILLVEDESSILELITIMLRRQGYTVLAASSPTEALRLGHKHAREIDLLLSDVVMPEMNGRDLAKNLQASIPNVKRLFMSGYTANVIAHHSVLDEGVSFIQKPFSTKELSAKVREVLDSSPSKS